MTLYYLERKVGRVG